MYERISKRKIYKKRRYWELNRYQIGVQVLMDHNSKAAGKNNPPRIYGVAVKTGNTVKRVVIVFFADEPQREENWGPLESDEEMVPILAAFVHENYPAFPLVGVL